MPDALPPADATSVARFFAGAAAPVRLLDALAETFDDGAAIGAFEDANGWTVSVHFRDPPNETAVRALVALAAGPDAANALTF